MNKEQQEMLATIGKPPEPSKEETYQDLLEGAIRTTRGKKQKLIYQHALQLLKMRGESASKEYLMQRGVK